MITRPHSHSIFSPLPSLLKKASRLSQSRLVRQKIYR